MSRTSTSCATIKMPSMTKEFSHSGVFAPVQWSSGHISLDGRNMWTWGENIYHSDAYDNHILDKNTMTWAKITHGIPKIEGNCFWTDGTNLYYSHGDNDYCPHYQINGETWTEKSWTIPDMEYGFFGNAVWTDGANIYYSSGSAQFVLNGDTWEEKTWDGLMSFYANHVWTDGVNIYYSNYTDAQYVLKGDIWEPKVWGGYTNFRGDKVWTDGANIYYNGTHILNGAMWEEISVKGAPDNHLRGDHIWTDGKNIYYSMNDWNNSGQRVLLPSTAKLYAKDEYNWHEVWAATP